MEHKLSDQIAEFNFLNSLSYSEQLRQKFPPVYAQLMEATRETRRKRLPGYQRPPNELEPLEL